MTKLKNLKSQKIQIMRRLSKIILTLVLLYLVPIQAQGEDAKECMVKDKALGGWASAPITYMVNECFQAMNRASLQNWGLPIQPFLGMAQCSCVTDKIRQKYTCQEDYNDFALKSPPSSALLIQKISVECVLEGAMGEEAKQAYLKGLEEIEKAESDNKTEEPVIKEPPSDDAKPASPSIQPTWKELSSQG